MSVSTKKRNEEHKEVLGLNRITKKRLLELCKKNKLYQTPALNDVLYLHYQGFEAIECLEDYTELKCLWLECNAISEIQGLDKLTKLKCLFLQSNVIRKIENLECCRELDTINLSQNFIRKIENCGSEQLPVLNTLNLASNYIMNCEGLKELENCKTLSVLDLSNNRIDDILVVKIFGKMPELKVLVLQGNPVVSKIPQYRKTLIIECKKLTYLDSRPVFDKDRACAEAWKRGGYQEERKENERWNRKERKKMRDGVNATIKLRNKYRKPDDQISLIPSSDSEEEINRQRPHRSMNEYEGLDSMWDEVSDDKKSDTSEMQTSSDTSSNSNTSDSEKPSESDKQDEPLSEYQIEDVNAEVKQNFQKPTSQPEKLLENDRQDENLVEDLNSEVKQEIQESESICQTTKTGIISMDTETSSDTNSGPPEKYQSAAEAIQFISKSEHSTEESSRKIKLFIENDLQNNEEDYEPLDELEDTMKMLATPENEKYLTESENDLQLNKMSINIQKDDIESCKINRQLRKDFEELSTNMDNFVKQLDKEREERKVIMKTLFDKTKASPESSSASETSDNETMNGNMEEKKWDSIIQQWDNETKLPQIVINGEQPSAFELMEKNLNNEASNSLIDNKSEELKKENISEDFPYVPLDVSQLSRRSDEALNTFEKEANELRKLLQKLETENGKLFNVINTEIKCQNEEYLQENNKKEFAENTEIVSFILDDMIQTLELESNTKIVTLVLNDIIKTVEERRLPRSYEFPEIMTDDEENNCLEPAENPTNTNCSTSIPQFKESFKAFIEDIKRKNLEELDKAQQKTRLLKEMAERPDLGRFHNDSLETLNAELERYYRRRKVKVRRLVEGVWAQKDRYNDTIELVDDKLMVRNKDTGELSELSKPVKHDTSDSEEDYDTAQSEDEAEKVVEQTKRKSYIPIPRRSSEYLITQALIENNYNRRNCEEEESEDSNDEFYSLESQDNKPNLYNIDKEFFNKLTLENLNVTETDANHIVHCARSYEELKQCLKQSKEDRSLTAEETELLENMIEKKAENPKDHDEPAGKLSKQEKDWFDKMMQKSKDDHIKSINPGIKIFEYKNDIKNESCGSSNERQWKDVETDDLCTQIYGNGIYSFTYEGPEQEVKETAEDYVKNEMGAPLQRLELSSEEEKAEVESNIDIENKDGTKKSSVTETANNMKYSSTASKNSSETQTHEEVLECNLEIIDCNDDLVDTITVNAEVHFEH